MTQEDSPTPPAASAHAAEPPIAFRLLSLGNSAYLKRDGVPESDMPNLRPEPEREAALGGRIERFDKIAWPTEKLPSMAERWIRETEPDAVTFLINEYWFNYRSVPALISRKYGKPGKLVAYAGGWAGRKPSFANSGIFQKARRFTENRIGGDAFFEPDHVIAISKDTIRAIIRSEGPVPLVMGPMGLLVPAVAGPFRKEALRRIAAVDGALQQFCETNHVEYWSIAGTLAKEVPDDITRLEDGVHFDGAGMRLVLEYIAPRLTDFYVRAKQQRHADWAPPPVGAAN